MLCRCMFPNPQSAVGPLLGAVDQIRSQRISFDVAIDLVEMRIGFNRKRLEATLVDVALSGHVVIRLPTSDMRHRQPLHESPQVAVILRPQNKMPMIGHQAITSNPHRSLFQSVSDDAFKRQEILVVKKQLVLTNAPIKNVKNEPTGRDSCGFGLPQNQAILAQMVNNWPRPRFSLTI